MGRLATQGGVEEGRFHAGLVQCANLVVHERDQRRDDDGDAMACALAGDGWNLIAQRLAATGGHQHQCVAATGHMVDDGRLRPAKLLVAKDLAQDGKWRGRRGQGGKRGQDAADCRRKYEGAGTPDREILPRPCRADTALSTIGSS